MRRREPEPLQLSFAVRRHVSALPSNIGIDGGRPQPSLMLREDADTVRRIWRFARRIGVLVSGSGVEDHGVHHRSPVSLCVRASRLISLRPPNFREANSPRDRAPYTVDRETPWSAAHSAGESHSWSGGGSCRRFESPWSSRVPIAAPTRVREVLAFL